MANRRMYAKSVIDTDKFMEMPISTQCLYFHLLLRGDDDGFVASPKLIMRQLRASKDDMKILIAKKYIIAFDSGVIVIREWFIHNQLRRDRFTPTVHKEKSMLNLSDDKIYRLLPSGVDSSGNQLATNGYQNAKHRLPRCSAGEDEARHCRGLRECPRPSDGHPGQLRYGRDGRDSALCPESTLPCAG